MTSISPSQTPAIRARNLCFSFGTSSVLEDVDVDIEWGEVTAIAGANGAGKSTLVEILAGVRRPASGVVQRAQDLALVVQRPTTPDALPLTVREVATMGTWARHAGGSSRAGRQERRRRVEDALARVELLDLADRPFNALSGGQRQRTLLAQGIARQADIFLLDEPAAGLDAASRARTRQILADEARRGAAVACVTHDEEAIRSADVVIRLDKGRRVS